MAITVTLDGDAEKLAAELVERGDYPTLDLAIDAGLRLAAERAVRVAAFWKNVEDTAAEAEAGDHRDMDEVFDELFASLEASTRSEAA